MEREFQILSAAVTDRGLSEKRPENEDSFLEMPKCGIYAVADGVGGAQAGEVASQMAMEIIGEAFTNREPSSDPEDVLRTAIERANAAIHQMSHELPQLANMASTVVALHLAGDVATIAHVGDSRAYSLDRDGEFVRETQDHSVVADEVRAGRMTEAQAENHPSKNIISRALGAESAVDVDIRTVMLEPGTSYLLCSDGVTRHVTDEEIKGVLTFGGDPIDICEYLKGLCYERGAEDNLTAVVVKTTGPTGVQEPPAFSVEPDETTVVAARSPFDSIASNDDDLLELGTAPLGHLTQGSQTVEELLADPQDATRKPAELADEFAEEAQPMEDAVASGRTETFSMFGETTDEGPGSEKRSNLPAILGSLLAGLLLGLIIYHFGLAPKPSEAPAQPITEMRSSNIPLSAFEENRRSVDKDPKGYLQKFPAPQDAEDNYLVGRAYVLTGDYAKARAALTAARDQLGTADPTNVEVLRHDIVTLLAVTSDTTIQTILRKEIEAPVPLVTPNTNADH